MSIDRTKFNLLVDDDGTNTTGSVWNKAAIKDVILDPTDAAIASTSATAIVQTTAGVGTVHDFALTPNATLLRCNNATLLTLTGLAAGTDGQRLDVRSVGAGAVVLSDQAAGSVAANRTITGLAEPLLLTPGLGSARLVYDATTARWCVMTTANAGWTDVPYASANFSAVGGGTWTVESGDQIVYRYLKNGRLIFMDLVLNTTSIAGTVTFLSVALPAPVAKQVEAVGLLFDNSGSVLSNARVYLALTATIVSISRVDSAPLAASTNNTYVRTSFFYEW